MRATDTPFAPRRPSVWARLRARVRAYPRWLVWSLVVAVGLLAPAGAGAVVWKKLKSRRATEVKAKWEQFDRAYQKANEEDLLAALEGVLSVTPGDERAARYRKAIESGEADEADAAMTQILPIMHARKNRLPEAAREGRKRLALEPNDWHARVIVAGAELAAGDLKAADAQLDLLPDPQKVPPSPDALILARELFARTGRDLTPFRRFVNAVVVDLVGSVATEKFPPPVKVRLVECYLIGFNPDPTAKQGDRLALAVAPACKLLDTGIRAATEADDATQLARTGVVAERLAEAFALLHRDKQITREQYDGLTREHEERVGKVWQGVIARSPKSAAAYHGLGLWHARGGRYADAQEVIATGMRECGEQTQLLTVYTALLHRDDQSVEATRRLVAAAEKDPENVQLWLVAAQSALAANRRDVALKACERARRVAPKHPTALRLLAVIHLEAGDPTAAVHLLRELGEGEVMGHPLLTRVYVRGLVQSGLAATVPDFLGRVEAAALKAATVGLIAEGVAGLTEAPFDAELNKAGLDTLERASARWPAAPEVMEARALLLRQSAEDGEPRWEPGRVRAAVTALERIRAVRSDDLDLSAALAWVRLKGAGSPEQAVRDAAPLVAEVDRGGLLSDSHLRTLGAVYVATGKHEDAVKLLDMARRYGKATASGSIHLALAHHALGHAKQAADYLADARNRPMTAQDRTDFDIARKTLHPEKP